MNLDNLQCFLTVCKYKSFSRAAEQLYITQSTVSRKVSALENELNVCLIERTPGNLRLTRAGAVLFEDGPNLLKEVNFLKEKLKSMDEGTSGKIRIGCYGLFFLSLVSIIKQYCKERYPRIELDFYYDRIKYIDSDIASNRADIYISLYCELPQLEFFQTDSLVKRQLMAFLPKTHELANRDKLSISDLKDKPMVFWTEEAVPEFYKLFVESCRQQGFSPFITAEYDRADHIVMELYTQNILTVMFDKTNVFSGELLKSVTIDDSNINVDIGYCYEKNSRNPAVNSLVFLLENMDLSGY